MRSTYYDRHPEQREKARARTKAWRAANKERSEASIAEWRSKNTDAIKLQRRAHYEKNREALRKAGRENYLANLEAYRSRSAQWKKDHPKEVYAQNQVRRIKRRISIKAALMKAQKGRCAYCRCDLRAVPVHIDHIMPLALNGANDRSNMQLTCDACNFSKNRQHPVDFARSRGMLL
jgi:5-methylcytosine-specific restriction endonuclease McrA